MVRRHLSKSLFFRLLSVFLAVIAPMYLLCFGIYRWGVDMTTDEILQSLGSRCSFFMNTLEHEIKRIRELQYECLHDDHLFYFVNAYEIMTTYEKITAFLSLQKRLSLMHNSSSYIQDVMVYIPHMNRMISAGRGVDPLTDEWIRIVSARADLSEAGIVYLDGEMYICSAYPMFPADPSATPLYILIIQLSSQDMRELLLSFNMYPDGGTMLSNPGKNHFLVVGRDIGLDGRAGSPPTSGSASEMVKDGEGERYLLVNASSEYLNMELHTYVSESVVYGSLNRYRYLFLGFTAAALVLAALFLWTANVMVNKPVRRLVRALTSLEQGRLAERIEHHSRDEFSYLYAAFNQMAESLERMIEINYRQKMLTREAELRQLQAQINPHFLHNSFFILYRMAKDEEYEGITEFLTYLSDYYRYITRDARMDVPLREEAHHARRYAQIQLIRFQKRIRVEFEPLPPVYSGMLVPRLILQPLLENAFDHGLKDVATDGRLRVWFEEEGPYLAVKVEDNGQGMDDAAFRGLLARLEDEAADSGECTGVVNIHRRLRLKFGLGAGLRLTQVEGGGLRCEILLPSAAPGQEEASGNEVAPCTD